MTAEDDSRPPAQRLLDAQNAHRAGKLAEAEAAYLQLANMPGTTDAERADACYGLGTVRFQQGQLLAALEALDGALALDPEVAEFHFNRALVLERLQRRDEAVAAFVSASQAAGGDAQVLRPAVERLLRMNAWHEASALLESAPNQASLEPLRARALAGAGDWAGARVLAQRLTEAHPQDPERWQWRSQTAAALRDYDDAIASHERYLSLLPSPGGDEHLAHADLLLSARRQEPAREALLCAKERGASGVEYAFLEARLARLEDDLPGAVCAANEVLALRESDGRAWQLLSEVLPKEALGDALERLAGVLASASPLRPGHETLLRFAHARLEERAGDLRGAWQSLVQANATQLAQLDARGVAYQPGAEAQVNDVRLQHYAPLASAQAPSRDWSVATPKVVFILGMPRSGTTLMERILGGLTGVHMGGENEAIAFIAAAYEHAFSRGTQAPPAAMKDSAWADLRAQYLARSLPPGREDPVAVTDKMPHNLQHVGLIAGIFGEDARVLWMRRHPVDVCLSIYSRRFPDGHRYACELEGLAHFYAESERLMNRWREAFPWLVHEVSYEELVAQPEPHARAAAAHAGLRWEAKCLDTTRRREAAFTFSELQVREAISERHVHRHRAWGELLDPLRGALVSAGVSIDA